MKLTIKEMAQVLRISGIVDEREISSVSLIAVKLKKMAFVPLPGTRVVMILSTARENGAIATLWQREGQCAK